MSSTYAIKSDERLNPVLKQQVRNVRGGHNGTSC